jgi:hypothetical protein
MALVRAVGFVRRCGQNGDGCGSMATNEYGVMSSRWVS